MRVLVVEDDRMIAKGLHTALRQDGYTVDGVGDGRSASEALRSSQFDLVLLDLGLPERDGLEVLRELRRRGDATPVIIVTARDDVKNRIEGLDAGADDYVIKPFDLNEVAARMRSVLRRAAGRGDPCIRHRGICLNPVSHAVERDGEPVSLPAPCSPGRNSRTGSTAGKNQSKATPSRYTCTACGASSGAMRSAHCAAS